MMTRTLTRWMCAAALVTAPGILAAQQPGRISVNFVDATMQEVAAMFANFSGRSILVGPGVDKKVNGTISNQPWEVAFQGILAQQGLSAVEMPGGIIRIDSPGELSKLDSIERLDILVKKLNYSRASEMAATISNLLTKDRGTVSVDTSSNVLVLQDTPSKLARISQFIDGLDIRTPTISIQAKLIFVDRTDLLQMGVKYDIGSSGQFFNKLIQRFDPLTGQPYNPNANIVNLGGNTVSAISNADALISGSALDLVFSTAIGGFSITSFLSALERVELTDVEAVPMVHTLDNKEANLLSGEEVPIRVIDASSFGQVNQAPRANVEFKQTGIVLTATPHVTGDGHIMLDLYLERSFVQPLAAADLGYTIPKQSSRNRLLVKDGEIAVMAGLTETTVTRNRAGIPLLSSLPFIGNLFSFSENRENRRDLILLVTPRIVDGNED